MQTLLRESLSKRNVILKARQHGITTWICAMALDYALFNPHVNVGIIAHHLDDVKVIFADKIKFVYDNLPDFIKHGRPTRKDREDELTFNNGSRIRVATSMRSGTTHFLHISEYGKIAKNWPAKAVEIKAGAIESVPKDGMIFVESTAEGSSGEFYDMWDRAIKKKDANKTLTSLDFNPIFLPWWRNPEYTLVDDNLVIHQRMNDYFSNLEHKHGIKLDNHQKAFYIVKEELLGDRIFAEYPSIPEEAFNASVEGAYFSRQMTEARKDGRICSVPIETGVAVDTYWDIGINDVNAIWFAQNVGKEIHLVDYYENNNEGMDHYVNYLNEWRNKNRVVFGTHYGPHDLVVRELGNGGMKRYEAARQMGIRFEIIPKVRNKSESIEAARNILCRCWFDEVRTKAGTDCLDMYRKEWDNMRGAWKDKPLHDKHSNGADAFQQLAMANSGLINRVKRHGFGTESKPVAWSAWT